jgi:hypothetical protein
VDLPARAFAVLLGVTLVVLGAAGGAWLGWRTAPDLISEPDAVALVAGGYGTAQLDHTTRQGALFGYEGDGSALRPLLGGDDYVPGHVDLVLAVGPDGPPLGAVRSWWLGGWRVESFLSDDQGRPVAATDRSAFLTIRLACRQPRMVTILAIVGALLGAAVAYAALRLPGRSRNAVRFAQGGVAALLPATLLMIVHAPAWALGDSADVVAPWEPFTSFGIRPLSLIGVVCLAVAGVLLVTSPARDDLGSDGDLWQGAARERLP